MSYNGLDIRREIILTHYENPHNKLEGDVDKMKGYTAANNNSPSCIDNITAFTQVKNDKIIDVKFAGVACAIATASTDIMANMLKNQNVKDANKFIDNYLSMIDNRKTNKKILGELIAFENVNRQLNRINCAKVGILAIKQALNKNHEV
ncbi:MAG: iron-sulfur cluster assembly scaffold protein [Mycoplasmataceae bacterium]|jgi:nitrogen fixation NifU-like protein|nr:iron-sulfur cluster assembly scaffold protein [Mycoplasmataceae bacterium]